MIVRAAWTRGYWMRRRRRSSVVVVKEAVPGTGTAVRHVVVHLFYLSQQKTFGNAGDGVVGKRAGSARLSGRARRNERRQQSGRRLRPSNNVSYRSNKH